MPKAVLDSTILVSIFLTPEAGGVAAELFHLADAGRFELFYSADIIRETSSVLLREERLRRRFRYSDVDVSGFCERSPRWERWSNRFPLFESSVIPRTT
jgi:predicted nucleic acid-binding protein